MTLAALLASLAQLAGPDQTLPRPDGPASPRPAVVLELFTSEGCSSCPPADRLLSRLAPVGARAPHAPADVASPPTDPNAPEVLALSFHVDYWNSLGWPDRFSNPAFTARQRAYAQRFDSRGVYTPQLIVNGSTELVGSDALRAQRAIHAASSTPATMTLSVTAESGPEASVVLHVTARPTNDKTSLSGVKVHAALAESGLSSDVKRGENAGHTLTHDHVVRDFQSAAPDANGTTTLTLHIPRDANRENSQIIIYAQDAQAGNTLGAVSTPVPK